MAYAHLRESLTKGNLWIYILAELQAGAAGPKEIKVRVQKVHGFSPATITFYSVLYKLRREGLVKRSSDAFRSTYEVTTKGTDELARAKSLIDGVGRSIGEP